MNSSENTQPPAPIRTQPHPTALNRAEAEALANEIFRTYFLPYQQKWILDDSLLKIAQKCRQAGMTSADAYHSVRSASIEEAKYDVYITSRDRFQAELYIQDCKRWAKLLQLVVQDLGEIIFDEKHNASAYTLQFANGRRIYSLSSNPNALAGKRGIVKIDEFALHENQRLLYYVAKPVTTWGGSLSIISTHRGANTVFNQIIQDILHHNNPMGWNLHTTSIHDAVDQGIVERINENTGRNETREDFLARLRAECIDEEQWQQEYCCIPSDETSAFLTYDLIRACETPDCLRDFAYLQKCQNPLYLGMDVARKNDLCIIDVGESIEGVTWDRYRVELKNKKFAEARDELYRLLALPTMRAACIDATGMGAQLAEEAADAFSGIQPITFTPAVKSSLAFALRADFEDHQLRIAIDDKLRADLHALRKEVTSADKIKFTGETKDSHCDRTWALALRQHATRYQPEASALVC